ncbi:MFS transporter [Virgibacillus massiliensis]|nr:MFS transporter [Virgibacillus massiliensis]
MLRREIQQLETQQLNQQKPAFYQILLVTGIVVIAFNLRPSITSVGPIIGTIRDQLNLSNGSVGFLTSLPLIAFAIMSPLVPKISNRYTNERVMLIGLIVLFIGVSLRSLSVIFFLFAGTLLIGFGIAICNVLLPSVIKEKFPAKVGIMTSVYSTIMGGFAATASGLSVPIASGLNLGWQIALFVWAVPALIGIIVWGYLVKKRANERSLYHYVQPVSNRIWKSPLAWQVAGFMGFQSFLFYVTISWLPEILHASGFTVNTAGWMLSIMQFIGVPASFIVPMLAGKFRSQQGLVLIMGLFSVTGYTALLFGESSFMLILSVVLIGVALGGTFPLALTILSLRARNGIEAAQLSGMAQSFGYILAAFGPFSIGFLYDQTHTWGIPLITLVTIAIIVILFGMGAGRDKFVFDE